MKKLWPLPLVALLALAQAPAQTNTAPSKTHAFRYVTIDLPIPYNTIGIAADNVAKKLAETLRTNYQITLIATGEEGFSISGVTYDIYPGSANGVFGIKVDSPSQDVNAAADRAVDALRAVLADRVQEQKNSIIATRTAANHQLSNLISQRDDLTLQLEELHNAIGAAGIADASIEGVHAMARDLDGQLEMTTVDIAGKTARQKALAAAISKLSDEMDAKVAGDPIAQQLQIAVDAKQSLLDHDKSGSKVGMNTLTDIDQATADLAAAKVALLERKDAAAKAAGADSLDQWNRDLVAVSVDLAEQNARESIIKSRVEKLRDVLTSIANYPSQNVLQATRDGLDPQIAATQTQLHELDDSLKEPNLPKLTVANTLPPGVAE
jgi:hypothetical protein